MLAVVLVAGAGAGCDGPTRDELSRNAQIYVATVREVLSEQPPPTDPDVLPVVYVVAVGEQEIPAGVQAEVAVALKDDVEVRFADERSEALLDDQDEAPVRDHGVLIAMGAFTPAEGEPVAVGVEIYRSVEDSSKMVLTVGQRSSQWTVTSSSVLPPDT